MFSVSVSHPLKHCLPTLIGLLLVSLAPAHAGAYKCRLPDGSIEITSQPCASGSATLGVRNDEAVSETRRREIEDDLRRMRTYLDQREIEQRNQLDRERQKPSPLSETSDAPLTPPSPPPARRTLEDCLRDLDRQAVPPMQRSQLENLCRSNPDSRPTVVTVPVYIPAPAPAIVTSPNPPAALAPHPQPTPSVAYPPARKATPPAPEKPSSVCLPGSKTCRPGGL